VVSSQKVTIFDNCPAVRRTSFQDQPVQNVGTRFGIISAAFNHAESRHNPAPNISAQRCANMGDFESQINSNFQRRIQRI
jgi:hypothetical protein